MIKQIAHICIMTKNIEQTYKFYTEILGLEKGFEFEQDGEIFGYYIKLGNNTFIEVFKGDPGKVGNINHVAIEVNDMDSLIEKIRSYGIDMKDKIIGSDHSWQTWVTDPNGIRIEFHEYTPQSSQITGAKCVKK
jgi:catechol 2,3-dioxygenase-like lactoylglutathione lyase family enzyme